MRLLACVISAALFFVASFAIDGSATASAYGPGHRVDVGGRRIYVNCTGSGSPTVILESGAGSFSVDWALVQPEIARTNRVCSYDRANAGWSDPAPAWDEPEQTARDLHTALALDGQHAPYTLVGQSMGGLFVRWFQHEYPNEVKGLILIDSYETTAPYRGKQVPLYSLTKEELQSTLPPPSSLHKPPLPATVQAPFDKLPPQQAAEHLELQRQFFTAIDFNKGPAMMESWREAFLILHNESEKPDSLRDLPLAILTRDGASPEEMEIQRSYLQLSSRSEATVVKGSGHFIQIERPEDVIAAIRRVCAESR